MKFTALFTLFSRYRRLVTVMIIWFLGIFLWISGLGMGLVILFFIQRTYIATGYFIFLITLAIIKGYEIFYQKGAKIEIKFVEPFGIKITPISDLISGIFLIYSAFYAGFTVLSIALLGQLPSDIPFTGLILIGVTMGSLMGISGYSTFVLAKETTFPTKAVDIQPSEENENEKK